MLRVWKRDWGLYKMGPQLPLPFAPCGDISETLLARKRALNRASLGNF